MVGTLGQSEIRRKATIRNGQLYMFWLAVLFVPTLLVRRNWFEAGILNGIGRFLLGLPFGSTFPASWYIMASVIAVALIAIASRWLPTPLIALVAASGYVFACLASNYGNLTFGGNEPFAKILGDLPPLGNPYNNFIVALLWVLLGRLAAQHEQEFCHLYSKRKGIFFSLLIIGMVLLFVEQELIRAYDAALTNDCYLTLPLPALGLFIVILNSKATSIYSVTMRNASTITYCFHATFAAFVIKGAEYIGLHDYEIAEFAAVLLTSWLITCLILLLENKHKPSILRYSH